MTEGSLHFAARRARTRRAGESRVPLCGIGMTRMLLGTQSSQKSAEKRRRERGVSSTEAPLRWKARRVGHRQVQTLVGVRGESQGSRANPAVACGVTWRRRRRGQVGGATIRWTSGNCEGGRGYRLYCVSPGTACFCETRTICFCERWWCLAVCDWGKPRPASQRTGRRHRRGREDVSSSSCPFITL